MAHPVALILIPRYPAQLYRYTVPASVQSRVFPGTMVRVSFGSSVHSAWVVEVMESSDGESLKDIQEVIDGAFTLTPALLAVARWMAEYYAAPLGKCIRLVFPPGSEADGKERLVATSTGSAAVSTLSQAYKTQRAILTLLTAAKNGLSRRYLRHRLGNRDLTSTLTALKRKGYIEEQLVRPRRARLREAIPEPSDHPMIPAPLCDQGLKILQDHPHVVARLTSSLHRKDRQPVVLQASQMFRHALYLVMIREIAIRNQGALVVIPSAIQAERFVQTARSQFGDRIAQFVGTVSVTRRNTEWQRVQAGHASIVIGTRPAAMIPVPSLSLIIVDDEQDLRHKGDQEPRFHTRDVAIDRANREGAAVLLGSASPSIETISMVQSRKAVPFFRQATAAEPSTPADPSGATHVPVQCVDMREAVRDDRVFSDVLVDAITRHMNRGRASMLLHPRKGFARSLWCKDCGATVRCPRCSVAMTFYKQARALACHVCGQRVPAPSVCVTCSGIALNVSGFGTERVEEEARERFPGARILRLDQGRSQASAFSMIDHCKTTGYDMLIGNSILMDLPSLPNVSLVGILALDTMLNMPDFRAAERTLHLLNALREFVTDGEMVIQTVHPGHPVLHALIDDNAHAFYTHELAARKMLAYPPFSRLVALRIVGHLEPRVADAAHRWARVLRDLRGPEIIDVLGPVPSPYARIRGRYRHQILIKESTAFDGLPAGAAQAGGLSRHRTVEDSLTFMRKLPGASTLKFEVDVDPSSFL